MSGTGTRLVIGTTTPSVRPGGIPSFLAELKSVPRYQDSVFLEWCEQPSEGQLSLGAFRKNVFRRFIVSQLKVTRYGWGADEIELHSLRTGIAALVFYRWKCTFFYHGPAFQEAAVEGAGMLERLAKYLVETVALAGISKYYVASRAFRLRLRENHGIPLDRIEVVRPSRRINPHRYRELVAEKVEASEHTGVVECVICRRLVQRVGILEFLDEFIETCNDPNVRITIAGHGPLGDAVAAACARDDRFTFAGPISDEERDGLYRRALFNLVPSLHLEGLGMVIYEGVAEGAVPLVMDCGGMPELLAEIGMGQWFVDQKSLILNVGIETAREELRRQASRSRNNE